MKTTQDATINVLLAITSAHEALFEKLFDGSTLTDAERYLARKRLTDPLWRPVCELAVNGMTSFEGALMLKGADLLQHRSFIVRGGPARETIVPAADLNDEGLGVFHTYCGGDGTEEKQDFACSLVDKLQAYAAIDMGSGLVANRSVIEGALDFDDWDLLRRLRTVPFGFQIFEDYSFLPSDNKVPRSEYMKYVSTWDGDRIGADIIDLSCRTDPRFAAAHEKA